MKSTCVLAATSLLLLCCACEAPVEDNVSSSSQVISSMQVVPIQTDPYQYFPENEEQTVDGYYGNVISYNGADYKWDMCIYDLYADEDMLNSGDTYNEAAEMMSDPSSLYLGECAEVQTYAFGWSSAECWLTADGRILAVWENTSDSGTASHSATFFSTS